MKYLFLVQIFSYKIENKDSPVVFPPTYFAVSLPHKHFTPPAF